MSINKISDLIDTGKLAFDNNAKVENQLNPLIVKIVNNLFTFFYSVCRGFEKQYADIKKLAIEKTQWVIAFQDEGFTDMKQIDHGIKRTRRESPINTPTIGQFIAWCMPSSEELGIPSVKTAYLEACKNSNPAIEKIWSHKVVQHAWKLTGSQDLISKPDSIMFEKFKYNYEITIRDWIRGKPIDEIQPPVAIGFDSSYKPNFELAKNSLSTIREMLK